MTYILTLILAFVGLSDPTPGCWADAWRCHDLTGYRGTELDQQADLQRGAKAWAEEMAADGILRHDPTAGAGYSEVVGYGPDWRTVLVAFDGSPHHREILLARDARQVGIGTARSGGTLWVVIRTAS
jgi:uncharacterized protein YkwD